MSPDGPPDKVWHFRRNDYASDQEFADAVGDLYAQVAANKKKEIDSVGVIDGVLYLAVYPKK